MCRALSQATWSQKAMKLKFRDGRTVCTRDRQEKFLNFLYATAFGRILLRPLTRPWVSKFGGWVLSTRFSRLFIAPFIRSAQIDMTQYETMDYPTFNAFFSRTIRPECRTIDRDPSHLISPCDSKLTAYPITPDAVFTVKHTPYTLASLLRDPLLAEQYAGGMCLIFRLAVDDYHRYCYIADGEKGENVHISGVFHTVNPIANDHFPIYKENTREYTILRTDAFGEVLMMEVGALMVGKIVNHHGKKCVLRGEEKGFFQFGGSTIVLLLKKDAVTIDADILENTQNGYETVVKQGERIGEKK